MNLEELAKRFRPFKQRLLDELSEVKEDKGGGSAHEELIAFDMRVIEDLDETFEPSPIKRQATMEKTEQPSTNL